MRKTRIRVFAACAAVCALGVASAAPGQTGSEPEPAATPGTVPVFAAPATAARDAARGVPAPPEGRGQVVFFRPHYVSWSAWSFSIREGDNGIARLGDGEYFVHVADPGVHEYTLPDDALQIEVQPGETYFVAESMPGLLRPRAKIKASSRDAFEAEYLQRSTRLPVDDEPN